MTSIEETKIGGITLVDSIVRKLRDDILSGALLGGYRLPSIRKAAVEFGVSKNTVVEAYDRLVASGLVAAKAGSGFVVIFGGEIEGASRPRHVAEAVDIVSLLSAQLSQSFNIRVGDGRPPPSWAEESEVKRHLGLGGRGPSAGADAYGSALGFPPLRQQIAQRLSAQHIPVSDKDILLTFGANHALDLVIRAFLSPGDVVLVDEPGYYPLFAKLKLAQIKMVGVRRLADGPDIEDLAAKAASEAPKMFFTQSLGHNPTGSSISLAVAHATLNIAARYKITIVEDDPFADLSTSLPYRLATLDQLNRVISIGSFSKTLSASLRSGHIAARPDRIAALTELKMLTTVNSSGHVERLLHHVMAEGHYDRHLKRLSQRIETAASRICTTLSRSKFSIFAGNGGGYYIYLLLPEGVNDMDLARQGAKESIFIAPGSLFCVNKESPLARGIRINVSRADDPRFYEFLLRRLT